MKDKIKDFFSLGKLLPSSPFSEEGVPIYFTRFNLTSVDRPLPKKRFKRKSKWNRCLRNLGRVKT